MKVLFVTLFPLEDNTSVTISNYGLLMGLRELGHEVTILMPHYTSDDSRACEYDLSDFTIERIPGLSFAECRQAKPLTVLNRIRRKWHKEFDFLDFTAQMLSVAKDVRFKENYYDIVISTSDPKTSHVFVQKLIDNGLQYGRWIQHWGDPMNGDITRRNCYPDKIVQWYERRMIKDADTVVYVSPFTAEMQRKAYPDMANKLSFVPLPCIATETKDEVTPSQKTLKLRLAYMGDYSSSIRNILPLYEACKIMPDVELTIAGISDLKLQSTDNIKVLPRVPHSQAIQIEEESDVSVTVCNLRGTQIPGKLYYSAAMQKHLLVLVDGDDPEAIRNYLKQFNRYKVADNNVESIQLEIKALQHKLCAYQCPEEFKPINVVKSILE